MTEAAGRVHRSFYLNFRCARGQRNKVGPTKTLGIKTRVLVLIVRMYVVTEKRRVSVSRRWPPIVGYSRVGPYRCARVFGEKSHALLVIDELSVVMLEIVAR